MRSDYAYAKFQGINGEEFFVKKVNIVKKYLKNLFFRSHLNCVKAKTHLINHF